MKILVVPPSIQTPFDSDSEENVPVVIVADSSLSKDNKPVFLPNLNHNYGLCASFALRIGKVGKHIAPRFCHRYIDAITAATWLIDINDIEKLSAKNFPWAWGCSFDGAITIGKWLNISDNIPIEKFNYHWEVGPCGMPPYAEADMLFELSAPNWQSTISTLSNRFTLKMGDIIVMGLTTPISVDRNYHISAKTTTSILEYNIK